VATDHFERNEAVKKHLSFVALGIAGLLALSACTGSAGADAPETTTSAPAQLRVWLVGADTPQEARDYLKTTFESENPGSTLVIEEQSWTGLVDKYTTALSGSDAPDVVEIGNTQAPTFTSAGAFLDLTDKFQALGGDDLLPGFVQVGSYSGKFYAAPYYSGARVITYSDDMVQGDAPTTWDDFLASAKSLTTSDVSGLWMPGKDWRDFMTFVWVNGGDIATQNADGTWTAQFSTEAGIKGLTQLQETFAAVSHAPKDGMDADQNIPFCAGQLAYLMSPSWMSGVVSAAPDATTPGCSTTYAAEGKLHQFAVPGLTDGTYAPVLAGGSNIAIPAKSHNPELAYKALEIMLSDGYQKILAAAGMVPAKVSQAQYMPAGEFSAAAANAAASAKLTPASPNWANVESQQVLEDAFSKIAQGQDVATVAAALDEAINAILNA